MQLRSRLLTALAASALVTTLATGAHAQDAGVTAPTAPALGLDDGYLWFSVDSVEESVNGQRVDRGFFPRAWVRVWGSQPADSAVVLTYSRGGRQLARVRCPVNNPGSGRDPAFTHTSADDCYDRNVRILGDGDVQVEIRAVNGQTDAETVLGTRTINVRSVIQIMGGTPPRQIPSTYYVSHHNHAIDSVLYWSSFTDNDSHSWSYLDTGLSGTLVGMVFTFNGTDSHSGSAVSDFSVRCQVNGQPLTTRNSPDPAMSSTTHYQLIHRAYLPPGSTGGTGIQEWKDQQYTLQMPFRSTDMRANPGRWTCDLRSNGETLRRWAWTVGANGVPEQHAEQRGGLNLGPRAILAETTIPTNAMDERTNPSEAQRGGFYGRPWTSDLARTQAAAVPVIGEPFLPNVPLRGGAAAASSSAGGSSRPGRRPRRR